MSNNRQEDYGNEGKVVKRCLVGLTNIIYIKFNVEKIIVVSSFSSFKINGKINVTFTGVLLDIWDVLDEVQEWKNCSPRTIRVRMSKVRSESSRQFVYIVV